MAERVYVLDESGLEGGRLLGTIAGLRNGSHVIWLADSATVRVGATVRLRPSVVAPWRTGSARVAEAGRFAIRTERPVHDDIVAACERDLVYVVDEGPVDGWKPSAIGFQQWAKYAYAVALPAPKLNCTTPGYNGTFTIEGASGVTVESAVQELAKRVNDATVALKPYTPGPYAPGQKHGPGQQGGSGPCDADCVKCANQAKRDEARAPPADPLDVKYDNVTLRELLERDESDRRDGPVNCKRKASTSAQRAAVAAHWSAELRAKVAASTAANKEREARRVMVDLDDDDRPW